MALKLVIMRFEKRCTTQDVEKRKGGSHKPMIIEGNDHVNNPHQISIAQPCRLGVSEFGLVHSTS